MMQPSTRLAAEELDLEAKQPLILPLPSPSSDMTMMDVKVDTPLNEKVVAPGTLPLPATESTAPRLKLSAAAIIPIWIVLSSAVILYNNYIFNTLQFKYPIFLVTWHLFCSALGTRILQRTTNLLDSVKEIKMSWRMYCTSILPIGVLFSGSLIMSNMAYLHLSVSFIQMLKAFNPVAILLISWSFRLQEPNRKLFLIVCAISGGVALAYYGEMRFDMFGFMLQAAAVAFEASRLVLIQVLLHQLKMDPLQSLHYYAPPCFLINAIILPFTEGLAPFQALASLGPWHIILLSNAAVAFGLNVAAVYLIGAASGLVLTLAGVFKDILLITGSVLVWGSPIAPIQIAGYSIALCGLVLFKTAK